MKKHFTLIELLVVKEQYLRAFDEYVKTNKIAITKDNRDVEFSRFVLKVYDDFFNDMVDFLRDELGCKALITDQNFIGYPNLTFQRVKYDLVDEHLYCGRDTSISRQFNNFDKIPRRTFEKPFQISEFSYTYPNSCRAEGGLLYPAVAAMQGWNGLYRFCHSNRWDLVLSPTTGLEMFDMVNDPARNIPERIAGMIFLRGDVQPLPAQIPTAVGFESSLRFGVHDYPANSSALLFSAQIGSLPVAPDGKSFLLKMPKDTAAIVSMAPEYKGKPGVPVITAEDTAALTAFATSTGMVEHRKAKAFSSATGEVQADYAKKWVRVVTPKTEGVYFDTIGGKLQGNALSAESKGQALVAATSLDNKPLTSSNRVLIVHVTDMQNEGTVFSDETMQTVLKSVHKQRPVRILFRNATAKIALRSAAFNMELYALDCSGKRLKAIPFTRENGWISFTATTDLDGTACFAYEWVRR